MARTPSECLVRILEDNRSWVVVLFCLPASFIFDYILNAQKYLQKILKWNVTRHVDKVIKIQKQVKRWNTLPPQNRKLLCTSRPNWQSLSTTFFPKHQCHEVAIPLNDILDIDTIKGTVRVEPMVTMGEITQALINIGYSLKVTIELVDATVGGLAMGVGMSTHSHKVGLFQETIESYEVVLSDGTLVVATKDNAHSDLFKALPWSHGSLAFLVGLTLQIVKVKPYIRMRYIPVKVQNNYSEMIRKISGTYEEKPEFHPDFIEATIFDKENAVIMTGDYSDYDPNLNVNEVAKWYKPWFYKHVKTFLEKGEHEELIPLRQYLLRHNRAIFWVVEDMISCGNHPMFRYLFGWLLPPKPAFLKFTTTPGVRAYTFTKQVFQDIVLPLHELEKQIDIATELFDCYPLLVYPCRIYNYGNKSGQLKTPGSKYMVPGTNYAMYNDLGVYGVPEKVKKRIPYNPVVAMRKMEHFTRDLGGFSFLYADIFMTKREFEEMFDLQLYEEVRSKYKAVNAFPHLYDKVKPEIDVFDVGEKYTN